VLLRALMTQPRACDRQNATADHLRAMTSFRTFEQDKIAHRLLSAENE
jgi:hypothetical protein